MAWAPDDVGSTGRAPRERAGSDAPRARKGDCANRGASGTQGQFGVPRSGSRDRVWRSGGSRPGRAGQAAEAGGTQRRARSRGVHCASMLTEVLLWSRIPWTPRAPERLVNSQPKFFDNKTPDRAFTQRELIALTRTRQAKTAPRRRLIERGAPGVTGAPFTTIVLRYLPEGASGFTRQKLHSTQLSHLERIAWIPVLMCVRAHGKFTCT